MVLAGCVTAVLAGVLATLYACLHHVPTFYHEALTADPAAQQRASQQMIRQAAAMQNQVRREGPWQAVFTADEINGWLAVELPNSRGHLLPPELSDPRLRIEPGRLTAACQAVIRGVRSIVSLEVSVYMDSPNVLALRIRRARVGAIPWPLDRVLRATGAAMARAELPIEWRQTAGDPVALVTLRPGLVGHGRTIRVESIRLEQGQITLTGSTEREK
jgi:hypothetical protein